MNEPLLIDKSKKGRRAFSFAKLNIDESNFPKIPENLKRKSKCRLPEVSQIDVVRHFTALASHTFGVDNGFYPLGSCTMKYNPKLNELVASYEGFTDVHPLQEEDTVQGNLELIYKLLDSLSAITGMDWGTLQPCAGAHGEYTGLKLIRAYFVDRKDFERNIMLIPESAHGTNPASATMNGFDIVEVASDERGLVDIDDLKSKLNDKVAGIMLTNPNTLGLFEEDILEISKLIHEAGGLLYYDGANANAILGACRPGDMGFDVVHLNIHKTLSTPHGGGGPGSGPVMVKNILIPYLPKPDVVKKDDKYSFNWDIDKSVGKVSGFWGNFLVDVKAYAYILSLGKEGIKSAGEHAVLNARYVLARLSEKYNFPYGNRCMHECVTSLQELKDRTGVSALDIAKGLLEKGYHPPTMYFPLIVHEALMIEPTETETKETLDKFCDIMKELYETAEKDADYLKACPHNTVVGRVDEVGAARNPDLHY